MLRDGAAETDLDVVRVWAEDQKIDRLHLNDEFTSGWRGTARSRRAAAGDRRLPKAGMSVSGLTASGSAIQLRSVGASCLLPMCDSSGPSVAAVAVDDVAADAVARPHPGRALDWLGITRVWLPRHLPDVRDERRRLALGDCGRRLAQARRDHLRIGHVAARAIPGPRDIDTPSSGSAIPLSEWQRAHFAAAANCRPPIARIDHCSGRRRHRPIAPPERRQRHDAEHAGHDAQHDDEAPARIAIGPAIDPGQQREERAEHASERRSRRRPRACRESTSAAGRGRGNTTRAAECRSRRSDRPAPRSPACRATPSPPARAARPTRR